MFIRHKNSMLHPSADNKHIHESTKSTFNIFFNLNCKSEYVIYLTECILYKMIYIGKDHKKPQERDQETKLHSSLLTFSGARA